MWRYIAALILMACAFSLGRPVCAFAQINLIKNGALSQGVGIAPADWYALSSDKKLSKFSWSKTPDGTGVLEIANIAINHASWHQALILRPGIYKFSAEVRVENLMPKDRGSGANLAIQTYDGIRLISEHLHGTADWQTLSFFIKEDHWGDTTELLCQLGITGYPDTGRAWFRNISVTPVTGRVMGHVPQFDLGMIREQAKDQVFQDEGGPLPRVAGIICGIALLALLGWALYAIWRPAISVGRSAWILAAAAMLAITAVKFAALFYFTGFYWDIWAKTNRALLVVALGPSVIYNPGLPVDAYPPGSLYLLWLSGWVGRFIEPAADGFRVLVETPPLIADLLIGLTLYFAAWRSARGTRALVVMMLFALSPALIFDTVVWGQSDSIVALPMLVAAILILNGRHRLGWAAAAIAILAKPQAIAVMAPLGLWTLLNAGLAECVWCAAAFVATIAVGILPYQIGHPLNWIYNVYKDLGTRFGEASVGAFNFLGLIGGMGTPDTDKIFGVSYHALGLSLTCGIYLVVAYMIWRARTASAAMLATFVALFGFFMFAPRMHERYLYYPLVFLIPIALESGFLTLIYVVVTGTFLINLLYIKHLTDTSSYFPDHANLPLIATASLNLAVLAAVTAYGLLRNPPPASDDFASREPDTSAAPRKAAGA